MSIRTSLVTADASTLTLMHSDALLLTPLHGLLS